MIERTNSRCCCNPHRESQLSPPSPPLNHKSKRLRGLRFAAGVLACALASARLASSQQQIEFRSLPELIEEGSQSLTRGDFPQAASAFNSIVQNYSEEPIWLEGNLPAKILPLAGYASHKANFHSEAISALETFLESYATEQDSEIFARYTLAASLLIDGQTESARQAFAELRATAGQTPFRDLATLREAFLSDNASAATLLQNLLANPASPRLATIARLQLIRIYLEQDDLANAQLQLLDTPWPIEDMPELSSLSYLATQVADALLPTEPAIALNAYQLVQSKPALIAAQQNRIAELRATYQNRTPSLRAEQSMWSDQFRQTIATLENQLAQLHEAPDYAVAIDIRKARCFAQINRPLEAWILLEPIATSARPLAREAELDWISIARQMQAWNASALIAQDFIQKYPDDEHAPQALFWIALSQIEQESFPPAITSLNNILATSPNNQLLASAHYFLGYCQFQLGQHRLAIDAFQNASTPNPDLPIAAQAQLWIGICQFTTNQLDAAITTFTQIQQNPSHAFLHPEAAYRQTAARYASGELEKSLHAINDWIAHYPAHPRETEARLLQGDILSELGQTEAAILAYKAIETTDPELSYLALEKSCTLQLDTGHHKSALTQLQSYRQQTQLPPRFVGPYTQLLATCLRAANHTEQAATEIHQAIKKHGNTLPAEGILELLLQTTDLETQFQNATDNNQPCLATRIRVAQIQQHQAQNQDTQAKLKSLALASDFDRANLPPEALLEAAKALAEIQSLNTPDYLEDILISYPDSRYVDDAYLTFAHYHHGLENPTLALAYLDQSSLQTPESLDLRITLEFSLQKYDDAKHACESQLADRQASPSQKAQALQTLGQIARLQNEPTQAYAYFQRIFTLYRGEPHLVSEAYLACCEILSEQSRYTDARAVAQEFLAQPDLLTQPATKKVQTLLETLPKSNPQES